MSKEQKLLKTIRTFVFFGIVAGALGLWTVNWSLNHPKTQPIAFSHKIHVGEREIACTYCHTGAERGDTAGVIAVADCMQCHQVVAYNHPEIQKLAGYWERKQPIVWFKNYRMPKHVHFSHKVHIAYGFQCSTCHGDLATMQVVKREHSFDMGFCVDCHSQYAGEQLMPGGPIAPPRSVLMDCTNCHR